MATLVVASCSPDVRPPPSGPVTEELLKVSQRRSQTGSIPPKRSRTRITSFLSGSQRSSVRRETRGQTQEITLAASLSNTVASRRSYSVSTSLRQKDSPLRSWMQPSPSRRDQGSGPRPTLASSRYRRPTPRSIRRSSLKGR